MNDDLRCAESLGIPRLTDVGDLAADVENWIVDWEVIEGMPEHAELAELCGTAPTSVCNRFDRYSTLGMKLRRTGPSIAEVDLFVRIKEEKESDHSPGAVEHEVPVSVRAKVDASTMPSISPGDLTSPTGLIGPGLETIAGLVQSSFKPSSKATFMVTYHKPSNWITESDAATSKWYGAKCDGLDGEWLIGGELSTSGGEAFTFRAQMDGQTLQGTYKFEGIVEVQVPPGVVTKTGTGRASIEVQADGSVTMILGALQVTSTGVFSGYTDSVTLTLPGWEFIWAPAADIECE